MVKLENNKINVALKTARRRECKSLVILTIMSIQDWFFDIILNFLRSPRWITPVMSFVDDSCIIFDGEDENKFEYTEMHEVLT